MRWIVTLILCLGCANLAVAQPTNKEITAMGICLTVLDLGVKVQEVANILYPQNNSQLISLHNTLLIYKELILNNMTADQQSQIVQTHLIVKQQFIESFMTFDNQELKEFVHNLSTLIDLCVDTASYQSGTIK